jgi:hypothetical protein
MYGRAVPVLSNSLFVLAIPRLSFRWLAGRFVPSLDRCKRAVLVGAVVMLAGCGGNQAGERVVAGAGYTFRAPSNWHLVRSAREVRVSEGSDGAALVGVSRFALRSAYRPALRAKADEACDRLRSSFRLA